MASKHTFNPPRINAADSGMQNPPTSCKDPQTYPMFSITQCHKNMPKPPCVGTSPTDPTELPTSLPPTTQPAFSTIPASSNTTYPHTRMTMTMTTTMAFVEQTQHLKILYDWQEFPRPPEMIPTSSKKTCPSPHAMHPMTMMKTTMTMAAVK